MTPTRTIYPFNEQSEEDVVSYWGGGAEVKVITSCRGEAKY